ncbi:hypothetical protein KUF71_022827, partial [Frankliniella fusca]
MEQEGVVEGFQASLQRHGLLYRYYIGDGDASVMSGIREKVSYGRLVQKVECANHVTRNFCDKVRALCNNTAMPLDERKVLHGKAPGDTIERVDRLVTGARGALEAAGALQRASGDRWRPSAGAVQQLSEDFRNLPYHVLGCHDKCDTRYCKRKDRGEPVLVGDAGSILTAIVKLVTDKLVAKVSSLVFNENTDDCERYMGMVAKMTGGKRVDYSMSGSYQFRATAAALQTDEGVGWALSPMRKIQNGRTPEMVLKKMVARRARNQTRRRLSYQEKHRRPDAPSRYKARRQRGGPDGYYGASKEDVDDAELGRRMEAILEAKRLKFGTEALRAAFERDSRGQASGELFHEIHKDSLSE